MKGHETAKSLLPVKPMNRHDAMNNDMEIQTVLLFKRNLTIPDLLAVLHNRSRDTIHNRNSMAFKGKAIKEMSSRNRLTLMVRFEKQNIQIYKKIFFMLFDNLLNSIFGQSK